MVGNLLVLLAAYLLGSIPTALVVARAAAGVDIRQIGDSNMGARNVTRTLGWGPGMIVALADFSKGATAMWLAQWFGLTLGWQLASGVCAVLGHDFPLFAQFRGGQGMAAILGVLMVLMPTETTWGLVGFGGEYILSRNFDLSAGAGLGAIVLLGWYFRQPPVLIGYAAILFISIGLKKWLDWPRRRRVREQAAAARLRAARAPSRWHDASGAASDRDEAVEPAQEAGA